MQALIVGPAMPNLIAHRLENRAARVTVAQKKAGYAAHDDEGPGISTVSFPWKGADGKPDDSKVVDALHLRRHLSKMENWGWAKR
jgi:hypothetical protein